MVNAPVSATVGTVHLRLFERRSTGSGPDDYEMPWAWGALCRVTFHIGERVTTKRIRQKYTYLTSLGWPTDRPSDASLAAGREAVLDNLRAELRLHGIEPPEFEIDEEVPVFSDLMGLVT